MNIQLSQSGKHNPKTTSSLYRTAKEARFGVEPGYVSIDGVQKSHRAVSLHSESIFARGKQIIFEKKRIFQWDNFLLSFGRGGIVSAILLGMITMGTATHFLGQKVWAEDTNETIRLVEQRVLGVETSRQDALDREVFEVEIRDMVKGYPIEDMVPYIVQQDKDVAAYLVAIAKKESNWGRRIPVYYGENCFNYWGYRGQDEIMGSAGHTCFDTPQEAVTVVARRLNTLVLEQGRKTASDLIIWKCGSSCAGHDDYGVAKWISDVKAYYEALRVG